MLIPYLQQSSRLVANLECFQIGTGFVLLFSFFAGPPWMPRENPDPPGQNDLLHAQNHFLQQLPLVALQEAVEENDFVHEEDRSVNL